MAKTEIANSPKTSISRPRDFFTTMRDEMDRVFDRFEHGFPRWPGVFGRSIGGSAVMVPELDVREDTDTITIEAELPGVDEKDVTVTVANGMLTIKGEKNGKKKRRTKTTILPSAATAPSSARTRLPDTVDHTKVEAKFDKGVLKVTAAKKPEAVKAVRKSRSRNL